MFFHKQKSKKQVAFEKEIALAGVKKTKNVHLKTPRYIHPLDFSGFKKRNKRELRNLGNRKLSKGIAQRSAGLRKVFIENNAGSFIRRQYKR